MNTFPAVVLPVALINPVMFKFEPDTVPAADMFNAAKILPPVETVALATRLAAVTLPVALTWPPVIIFPLIMLPVLDIKPESIYYQLK